MQVDRLFKIAEILEMDVRQILGLEGNQGNRNTETSQPKVSIEIPITI